MSASHPSRSAGSPSVALLLGWFLPGAGHLYLGRLRTGLIAFVVIEALYGLGVFLSGGMFLEYLPPEMRGRFAGFLTPEVGNLGALLAHMSHYGYGIGHPRPYPALMDVGTTLTAVSGVLNLVVLTSAHLTARRTEACLGPGPSPSVAAGASLILPGLGQFMQGRRARGVLIALLLISLFSVGCFLGDGSNLDRERHFYYWAGQFMLGLPALATEFAFGHPRLSFEIAYADGGVVLGCAAGLLNVLVMLDAFHYAEHGPEPDASSPAKAPNEKRGGSGT
jgi:TM2 domain-containing membrane protein YozV